MNTPTPAAPEPDATTRPDSNAIGALGAILHIVNSTSSGHRDWHYVGQICRAALASPQPSSPKTWQEAVERSITDPAVAQRILSIPDDATGEEAMAILRAPYPPPPLAPVSQQVTTAEVICPSCKGSGQETARSCGYGPDDHEVECECGQCGGSGVLAAPVETVPAQVGTGPCPHLADCLREGCNQNRDGAPCDRATYPAEAVPAKPDALNGNWYCEKHPMQLMGHDGCEGAGILECAQARILANLLRLAQQEIRETAMHRDDLVAQMRAVPAQALGGEAPIVWPKSESVRRRDDMSAADTLQVGKDESGDLQISLWTESAGYSSVEFCSGAGGGGRSPNTRRALIALMVAMEADNEKSPLKASDAALASPPQAAHPITLGHSTRNEAADEIVRLRALATCGCGDGFTEHDPGTCGACVAGLTCNPAA